MGVEDGDTGTGHWEGGGWAHMTTTYLVKETEPLPTSRVPCQ